MNFNVGALIGFGQVSFSGVAVQIPNFEQLRYGLYVVAPTANSGNTYLGGSGVTTGTGLLLTKTQVLPIKTDRASNLYVISDAGGVAQSLGYLGF